MNFKVVHRRCHVLMHGSLPRAFRVAFSKAVRSEELEVLERDRTRFEEVGDQEVRRAAEKAQKTRPPEAAGETRSWSIAGSNS